jgi:hypothetical protein
VPGQLRGLRSPREISSRSASVKASRLRRRSGGGRPPRCRICAWTVPGPRSSARPISLTDSPRRQRCHSCWRSSAEYRLRFLATATPPSSTAAQCCDEGLRAPSVTNSNCGRVHGIKRNKRPRPELLGPWRT